ncbi:MAG: hypothetical protein AAGD04_06770 [Pseudomonadota bacterium]
MDITLLIFLLTIQSSYTDNIEAPANGHADTVQWTFRDDEMWRIRTFAVDQDVHIYKIGRKIKSLDELVEAARRNTLKHYGDVISKEVILHSLEGLEGLTSEVEEIGMDGHLNERGDGVLFWSPSGSKYSTKSKPVP